MSNIFTEIGVVVIIATLLALIMRRFKQPPLVGYILTGIILGPLGVKILGNTELFEALRQIGTALLLFLVGLELDWTKAKYQLKVISLINIIILSTCIFLGLVLATYFNLGSITAIYLGISLAFSSTIIVVKLLSENHDLGSLHGRIAIGTLIMQDISAILILTLITGLSQNSSLPIVQILLLLIVKLVSILILLWILSQYIFPNLFSKIAKSGELLFISSLSWCFFLAICITLLDFPLEIGAFLAGVTLASLPYSAEIANKLKTLRDFFVIILFVTIGSALSLPDKSMFVLTFWLTVITVVLKPAITTIILILNKYKSRTSFMAGLTQGQNSEFALIIAALGITYGQIKPEMLSIITFSSLVATLLSTIIFSNQINIYKKVRHFLHKIESLLPGKKVEGQIDEKMKDHIVIFGYHRMGYHILKKLRALKHDVIIVDYNPDIIKRLQEQDIPCVYGDIEDEDILELTNAGEAKMVISTIPHREETTHLIGELKKLNEESIVIVTSNHIDDALSYYKQGASYVILPHVLGGEHIADIINWYEHHELHDLMKNRSEEIQLLKTKNHALYYD